MAEAVQPLRRANGSRAVRGGQAEEPPRESQALADPPAQANQVVRQGEGAPDVPLDVEVIVQVGLAQGEFAGRPEQRTHRAGVLQDQRKTSGGPPPPPPPLPRPPPPP